MSEVITFLNEYCDFSDPNWIWILKGVSRNKDNNDGVKFFRRMILTQPEDFAICRQDIINQATDPLTVYRLYISLNSRDVIKGTFNYQKKLIEIGMGLANGQKDQLGMCKKLGSIWKTELEQRTNRGTKRFLLDIDEEDDDKKVQAVVAYLEQEVKTKDNKPLKVHCMRRTVSGYAIVFDACDTRGVMKYCNELKIQSDLHRDSMVFLEAWNGGKSS